ncbi:MAG: aminotransferase class III-fold pyridoxal phosphate-dependent enzyme [Planctomycetota bacterium]|nr:aminotransferase class III-fold pyridoxal phosphate-dependent enzyme [Planctomycetota bacterium]
MPTSASMPAADRPANPDQAAGWARRSLAVLPAGSNGEFDLPADLVRVIDTAKGCRLRDAASRDMVDFSMGWGSVLPGHAREEILTAVRERLPKGTNFSYPSTEAICLAEELQRIQPTPGRRVRFCASGTEATMYCLRLARAFTERKGVLKFEGAYHGSNDEGVTSLFPSGRTPFPRPEPSSAGISAEHTMVAPYNDLSSARAIITSHAKELACVIVEPLHRCLAPRPGFLAGLREVCDRHDVLLVFDEVVTGFRMAYGGAQAHYGVTADLIAYGKALGGGLPIGAFVGRPDIMDIVREDRAREVEYVWTASTLGGNPVSCAAALAALDIYRQPGVYSTLHALGERFRESLRAALRDTGHVGQVIGDGPLGQIVFSDRPVFDYRTTIAGDRAKSRAMMLGLFRRGVFVNPMGTKLYLSLAHANDEGAMTQFDAALREVLKELAGP